MRIIKRYRDRAGRHKGIGREDVGIPMSVKNDVVNCHSPTRYGNVQQRREPQPFSKKRPEEIQIILNEINKLFGIDPFDDIEEDYYLKIINRSKENPEYNHANISKSSKNQKDDLIELVILAQDLPRELLPIAIDLLKNLISTAQERSAQGNTDRVSAVPRLKWETDALPGEDPATFTWRAYAAEAAVGKLHRGLIRTENPELHRRLNSWLRSHPMPEGIDIPTKPEWNTRQLAKLGNNPAARETKRLLRVERGRAERLRRE